MGRAASTAALVTLACSAVACTAGPPDLDWALRFEDPGDEERTRAVEVCIVEGECPEAPPRCDEGARVRYRDTFQVSGDVVVPAGATRPPQLARGRYAFVARARDAGCVVVASGCTEIDLPATSVAVPLEPEPSASADCCGATCEDGVCRTGDAGPPCEDDEDPCTVVGCDASGACVLRPLEDGMLCLGADGPCTESRCVAGACTSMPLRDGTGCSGPDADPCRDTECRGGACVEVVPANDGAVCGAGVTACTASVCVNGGCVTVNRPDGILCGEYRNRCCSGSCVDIFTDPNHCSACGQRCGPGFACRNRGGLRETTCDCAMGNDCPGGTTHFDCMGSSPGRCVCTSESACAPGQACVDTMLGRFCAYPR